MTPGEAAAEIGRLGDEFFEKATSCAAGARPTTRAPIYIVLKAVRAFLAQG
jgi:hypothetical protein